MPTVFSNDARHPLVLLMVCLAGLSGCAASPQARVTTGGWEPGAQRQVFTKVLVVGISKELNQRCGFERFMVSRLETEATTAIASCDVVNRKEPLSRDQIEAAVAAQQADAVLSTSLVSREWGTEEGGSRDTRGSAQYKATESGWATGYYGAYGVPVVYGEFHANAASVTMQGDFVLASRLFETRNGSVVYTLTTEASRIESSDVGLSMITEAIANRLRKEGLTR